MGQVLLLFPRRHLCELGLVLHAKRGYVLLNNLLLANH